jgi:hypothetical protein
MNHKLSNSKLYATSKVKIEAVKPTHRRVLGSPQSLRQNMAASLSKTLGRRLRGSGHRLLPFRPCTSHASQPPPPPAAAPPPPGLRPYSLSKCLQSICGIKPPPPPPPRSNQIRFHAQEQGRRRARGRSSSSSPPAPSPSASAHGSSSGGRRRSHRTHPLPPIWCMLTLRVLTLCCFLRHFR